MEKSVHEFFVVTSQDGECGDIVALHMDIAGEIYICWMPLADAHATCVRLEDVIPVWIDTPR
jgi:hypothetical protein